MNYFIVVGEKVDDFHIRLDSRGFSIFALQKTSIQPIKPFNVIAICVPTFCQQF